MIDNGGDLDFVPDAGLPGPAPTRTPMYEAFHNDRYQRQALIKEIQERTGRRLICYVAAAGVPIDNEDTVALVDLLYNVPPNQNLDLLLHTTGGEIDAAEKLSTMVRLLVQDAELRVIVPDMAKSAGTLMALGADRLLMSDTSELGPIDPLIVMADRHGNRGWRRVQSYIDAYETHAAALRRDPADLPSQIMLGLLDPVILKLCESARERAQRFAENQLKLGMFRNGGNYTKVASDLIDTNQWLAHGQMIGWQHASGIGLMVDYLEPRNDAWRQFWRLYCLQRLTVGDKQKLFESDYVSLQIEGRLA